MRKPLVREWKRERERAVERKVNSRERKDGKNQQRRIASEGEREKIEGKEREKETKKRRRVRSWESWGRKEGRQEGWRFLHRGGGISSGIPKSTRE